MVLEKIHKENDIKNLSPEELTMLADEIRQFLIEKISVTGGHLASNLGVVELTMALHLVFDLPQDKLIWDVGHQAYTHKLLTGRKAGFDELRKYGGMSGFPKRKESECDAFDTGHSSTSISAGLGYVAARELQGGPHSVVSIIGDGSMTGGMAYEALNNASRLKSNFIIVLNDNTMSISKNVGALSRYLSHLRTTSRYYDAKENVRSFLEGVPVIGPPLKSAIQNSKAMVRRAMYHSTMFEDMGFHYYGPFDGNNEPELEGILRDIHRQPGPHFLHVVTKKGKGYAPAESNPGNFHGVSTFDLVNSIPDPEVAPKESFSTVFGNVLNKEGAENQKICAITAAMKYGTGLQFFAHTHPKRFFDVGMAEQHAVTFAAGLASQGMLPVVCIYSTFLQRSYDQIIHDVNLLKENVVLAIDRAGFVPADGETHQGIFDPAFLSQVGIPVYSPSNYAELRHWLPILLSDEMQGPRAIRYPRGGESAALAQFGCSGREYDRFYTAPDAKAVMVSYADEVEDVLTAAKLLGKENVPCDVYKLVKIYPFTPELISEISRYDVVLFAEECVACGGIGEHLETALRKAGWQGAYIHRGVEDVRLPHATVPQIKQSTGLDAEHLAQAIRTWKGAES